MVKFHVVDVHTTTLDERQHTSHQNIERIPNAHDFSHDLKNKSNYSQMVIMLQNRGVLNSIMDLNI